MKLPKDLDLEGADIIFQKPRTALIPMITGPLSAFGSYLVIRELWGSRMARLAAAHKRTSIRAPLVRLILSISAMDFVAAIAMGLSTIPLPRHLTYVPYAMGNFQTCDAQAFVVMMSYLAIMLYLPLLSFFYLLIIKYQWTDVRIRKVEMWGHGVILTLSLGFAILPVPFQAYNNTYHFCFTDMHPYGCQFNADVPCERGATFIMMISMIFQLSNGVSLLAVSVMMFIVYREVRKVEDVAELKLVTNTKYSGNLNGSSSVVSQDETCTHDTANLTDGIYNVNRNRSRAVAVQGFLFVFAYVLTNILRWILTLTFVITQKANPTLMVLGVDVMQLLQGFFNAIVLLRTSTLHTPEGKFVQKGFNACWSLFARVWHFVASHSSAVGQEASAIELGDMDLEDEESSDELPLPYESSSHRASSTNEPEQKKWNARALEMFLDLDSVYNGDSGEDSGMMIERVREK